MSMLQLKNIPEPLKRALRRRAKETGQTMSEYVLGLIERDLGRLSPKEIKRRLERLPRHDDSDGIGARFLEEARREREEELGW